MAQYQVTTVSKYYEVFRVEADDEAIAEELVYSGDATLIDSYGGGEDSIYDIIEVENG